MDHPKDHSLFGFGLPGKLLNHRQDLGVSTMVAPAVTVAVVVTAAVEVAVVAAADAVAAVVDAADAVVTWIWWRSWDGMKFGPRKDSFGWWFQIFFIFIPIWGNDPI